MFMKFYLVKMCPIFVGSQLSCLARYQKSFEDVHLDVKICLISPTSLWNHTTVINLICSILLITTIQIMMTKWISYKEISTVIILGWSSKKMLLVKGKMAIFFCLSLIVVVAILQGHSCLRIQMGLPPKIHFLAR